MDEQEKAAKLAELRARLAELDEKWKATDKYSRYKVTDKQVKVRRQIETLETPSRPSPPYMPSQRAAYSWLLRRLFSDDAPDIIAISGDDAVALK